MHITPEGLASIKSQESLCLTAYMCPGGILTIGYGHTGDDVYAGETITEADAELLLRRDVSRFELCVASACVNASPQQFTAMVSLAFNIGEAAFKRSSVVRLHNSGQHAQAAQAFALWNKARGRVLPGLVKRRAAEAALYLSDTDDIAGAAIAEGEKPLNQSRVIRGQAVALASTAGTVALGAAQGQSGGFGSWSDILVQVLPYAAEVKWLLVVLIVLGIGYAVYARIHDRKTGRA